MFSKYVVVDDKLVPSDIAPLVLTQKLQEIPDEPVSITIHHTDDGAWKIPEALTDAVRNTDGFSESFIREMAEKMVSVNGTAEADLRVRIYPGKPGVLVIDNTVF